jgi:hypothetical protein
MLVVDDEPQIRHALKDILGHKTLAMTIRYSHLSTAYRRSMVDRMEQIWAKPAKSSKRSVTKGPRKLIQAHERVAKPAIAINA